MTQRGNPNWRKGVSGNPTGRKAVDPEVKEALGALTPRAVDRLTMMLESEDERIAMDAVKTVLDRNLGKPTQPLEHSGPDGTALLVEINVTPADVPALTDGNSED